MNRYHLIKELLSKGFVLIRNSKHEVYSNGKIIVIVPYHKEINRFTAKGILKQIA